MSTMDAAAARPSPLTEHIQIVGVEPAGDDLRVLARTTVDPDNPILAGHYPGLPIFPGVCLIECAHRTVLIAAHSSGLAPALESVSTARFTDAVLPGDMVSIQALITRTGTHWKAVAVLRTQRGPAARVILHYGLPGGAS